MPGKCLLVLSAKMPVLCKFCHIGKETTMQITIAEIVSAEIATRTVNAKLEAIGREICKMREGEELLTAYEYERRVS
jgi:hypothetical protein